MKQRDKMKNITGFFLCVVVAVSLVAVTKASNVFKVGDTSGWRQPEDNTTEIYNQWAAEKRFLVGDSLVFEYKAEDSVLVVNKSGYYHCNTTKPISTFNNGKTMIKLDNPGPIYFISGALDHCKNGQRLIINVMTLHPPTPPSPPSIAVPPAQSFPSDAPAPSPNNSGVSSIGTTIQQVLLLVAVGILGLSAT
ncbi:hypothetical protein GIB67_025330 [Kingdonia uniflora]|uniref:Phytocyanin domain-containing protein n=1 Tax=Kingdonia uniflora TaxID=39325 RepID=A0A7J7NBS4_9MAGN|nr:hypothetical protein GIB67_025330 [Kingdonia uniflora]